jgi:hypothetical protein
MHASLPAAIALVESKDVSVTGNRFGGMDELVQADAQSSFRAVDNQLEACPADSTRFLPPDEAGDVIRLRLPACR